MSTLKVPPLNHYLRLALSEPQELQALTFLLWTTNTLHTLLCDLSQALRSAVDVKQYRLNELNPGTYSIKHITPQLSKTG
jgi:hypothetical protein